MKKLIFFALLFLTSVCHSQDYQWWNVKHKWDGVSPWSRYIIIAPAFMGPNALPVPDIKNGLLPDEAYLEFSLENHFSIGDKTENLFTKLFTPLFSDRAGLDISIVPLEHYKMDSLTRDIRRARDFDGEGFSGGDFYIGTYIQVVKEHPKLPDVLITINMKTASGTRFDAARFTDGPGYFIDMSFGKEFLLNHAVLKSWRPYALLGFYSWQINGTELRQNDALMYGAGLQLHFSKLEISNAWGGYRGFINDGDRPMVYRLVIQTKRESKINYKLMLQQGLNDFDYTTLSVGCRIVLPSVIQSWFRK